MGMGSGRRFVVKLGGQGRCDQAIKLFQKLVLSSIFDTSFILHDVKLAELSNKF